MIATFLYSPTTSGNIVTSLLIASIPAIAAACGSYLLARKKNREDRDQLLWQQQAAEDGQFAGLRQRYITPLRFWASLLTTRMKELEGKKRSDYSETSKWFQEVKDHADGSNRIYNFPFWCCYQGIFAITTLYWTGEFLQASREIRYQSPFNELDSLYNDTLQEHLNAVREAFVGNWGIWDSSQEVVGELLANGADNVWNYQDFCKALDSRDNFKIGPLLRPLDYYIQFFTLEDSQRIQSSLNELIRFLDSQRTPELLRDNLIRSGA
jgi:hypothetical protein